MKVSAPSLAALSQLSQFIGKQGMTAEIQSSTPVAGGVEAHVQLRRSIDAGAPMNKTYAAGMPDCRRASSVWWPSAASRWPSRPRAREFSCRLQSGGVERRQAQCSEARRSCLDAGECAGDSRGRRSAARRYGRGTRGAGGQGRPRGGPGERAARYAAQRHRRARAARGAHRSTPWSPGSPRSMSAMGLRSRSITVDRAPRPGVVNATITFTQPQR